jgi:hypothetical protein
MTFSEDIARYTALRIVPTCIHRYGNRASSCERTMLLIAEHMSSSSATIDVLVRIFMLC